MLARMSSIYGVFLAGLLAVGAGPVLAQQLTPTTPAASAPLSDGWNHVKSLQAHQHMHVAADHGGSTCYFISADDASLTCGRRDGGQKGQHVFPRADVKSIKLTRRGISTAGGLGIGLVAGGVIGAAAIRPDPSGFNLGLGAARAGAAVIGGIGGAVVGGTTDMFRGPVIYRRTEPGT